MWINLIVVAMVLACAFTSDAFLGHHGGHQATAGKRMMPTNSNFGAITRRTTQFPPQLNHEMIRSKMSASPSSVNLGNLDAIQRKMYESLRNSDGTAIHVEADGMAASITLAASNFPGDELQKIVSEITSAHGFEFSVVDSQAVSDPESSSAEIPGSITMLKMHVSSPVSKTTMHTPIKRTN